MTRTNIKLWQTVKTPYGEGSVIGATESGLAVSIPEKNYTDLGRQEALGGPCLIRLVTWEVLDKMMEAK
jgi:hypothetical protein